MTRDDAVRTGTLRVDGASLYYEVRGAGPLLLMIPPGNGDAGSFFGIAPHLAERFTVVTYDRRGYSRSPLDNPDEEQRVEPHSEDARRLIEELGGPGACVFASSAGALIGIDLVTRHSSLVRVLVAHEPPAGYLLPESERPPREEILASLRREGSAAALDKFRQSIGVNLDDREPEVDLAKLIEQSAPRAAANQAYFVKRELASGMLARYVLDFPRLTQVPTRIVIAGGRTAKEQFPYRCAAAVAERLGRSVVEFPGGHAGFVSHPRAFSQQLGELLTSTR